MKTSISTLKLPISKRVKNALYYLGRIETLDQLQKTDLKDIEKIRGIGQKGLAEIQEFLTEYENKSM